MNAYWWRLTRPGWLTGAIAAGCAVVVVPPMLGQDGGLPGVVFLGHGVNLVLATAAAAPLRDPAAPVLDAAPKPRVRRRLAPVGCAVLTLTVTWPAIMALLAARVPALPWGGLAVEAAAMIAIACAAGVRCTGRADPGLAATGVLALIVLLDQGTALGPWLTGGPGSGWRTSREAWAVLGAGAVLLTLFGLRDAASRWSSAAGRGPRCAARVS
ncbi:hypothetical protein ODJ79_16005 [Actinoplanes sp. KI2]|uniref:hypothetical protein n=1 Tax=Actinoplanes sp. KI2 TaxID=2983315 RepID=UPI0021D5852A|nr:hypothetical protein [Actinoplanes sp. KI2]MCU7725233.1 hypothetical protein [Actinoplanes sp. KI2]